MKKFNVSFLVLVTLFLLVTVCSADEDQAAKTAAPASSTEATTTPPETGKVVVSDRDSRTIKITTASGDKTFTISSNTKILVNGKEGKIDDMGPGMDASIVPGDYPSVALSITATGTPPVKPHYDFTRKKTDSGGDKKKKKK